MQRQVEEFIGIYIRSLGMVQCRRVEERKSNEPGGNPCEDTVVVSWISLVELERERCTNGLPPSGRPLIPSILRDGGWRSGGRRFFVLTS